jgi:transcriptional regulator with XRE-family HTH domain
LLKFKGAALGWSTRKLAEVADVGLNTVNRFECGKNSRESSTGKMVAALEKAGRRTRHPSVLRGTVGRVRGTAATKIRK